MDKILILPVADCDSCKKASTCELEFSYNEMLYCSGYDGQNKMYKPVGVEKRIWDNKKKNYHHNIEDLPLDT